MTLFNICAELLDAYEKAESGEYSEQAIADTLDLLELDLKDKADNYAAMIRTIDGENETIDKEVKRLQALKASKTRFKDYLKNNLQKAMETTDNQNFKTAFNTFWIQDNAPCLDISAEAVIPEPFYKPQAPQLDRRELLQAVKEGLECPGVTLKQTRSLRIR